MKKFLLSTALIVGSIVTANATTLFGIEIFVDNNLVFSVTNISGGGAAEIGAGGSGYESIDVVEIGDSLGNLSLTASAFAVNDGFSHNLTILGTQYNIDPTSTALSFTNTFTALGFNQFTTSEQNFISVGNLPFQKATAISPQQTFSCQLPCNGTNFPPINFPGNATLNSLSQFSETIMMSIDSTGGLVAVNGQAIQAITVGVPEPSTWAMMLLGFAGLGFAFRQSRRTVRFA